MNRLLIIFMMLSNFAFSQVKVRPERNKDVGATNENSNLKFNSLTMRELREGKAGSSQLVFVNEGIQSGYFRYNALNIKAVDDSSLILKFHDRAYERIFDAVRPEYFGANPEDTLDDGPAIQKALNSATTKGIKIIFSEGTYYTSIQLVPKIVEPAPVFAYKLTLEGAGAGLTSIKATHNRDILNVTQGQISFTGRESDIIIRDLHLDSNNKAAHGIYANHVANFKVIDCKLTGATQSNLKIGSAKSENYGIDIIRCYSNGKTVGENHNMAGIELYNARYVNIDHLVTDGSKYGIHMRQSDKSFITNCHIEGSKTSSIHITGTGGGEHKISNNMLFPYVQYEPSAKFDGRLEALHIEGTSGGGASNVIYGNVLLVQGSEHLPLKFVAKKTNGLFRANPIYSIKGISSLAEGVLFGYDPDNGILLIQPTKGTFKSGETIKQSTTGGMCTLGILTTPTSVAISITGSSTDNIISNNQIKLNPSIGIYIAADNNIISNNNIHASTSILKDAPFSIITGNYLNSIRNVAFNNVSGKFSESGNRYIGEVRDINIQEKQ